MVSTNSKDADKLPSASISEEESVKSTTKPSRGTSTSKTETNYLRTIRSRFRRTGFSKQATDIMCSSWRTETQKRYACYVAKWRRYAHSRHIDPISPSISEDVNFLAHLYKSGLGYSAICVARSALSSYLNIADVVDFGQHKIVRRFMKGVFELKPVLPKYSHTWDVDTVLNVLECYTPNDKLTLKELSHKLVMLLALLTGQRCQTIHKLSVKSMKLEDNKCVFYITSLLKQSKQGKHLAPIELLSFPRNKNICVVEVIKEYLRRTKVFRDGHTQLLLSYLKPHLPISKDTLARWIRDVLHKAGVDTQFGAHSTRSASTSAAASKGLPIDIVLKAAGWSSASTFTRFYKREPVTNMWQTILESYFHQK